MSPYECYVDYLALKRHFTTKSYDFIKYKGKIRASKISFEKRKDRFFFEKIAKHRDPHNFLLANFIHNPSLWIRDIAYTEVGEQVYQDWLKRQQSLTYFVSSELSILLEDCKQNFEVHDGQIPHLIQLLMGNKVSLETVLILVDIVDCMSYWNKKLKDNIIWDDIGIKLNKAKPFINYDKEKLRKLFLDKFS